MEDHSSTNYSRKDRVEEGDIPVRCLFSFLWLVIDFIYLFYLSALVYLFPFFFSFFLFYLFPLFPLFLSPKRDCMRGSVEYYNSFLEIRDLSDVLGTRVLCEKYSFTNPPFLFFVFSFLLCSLSRSNPPPFPNPRLPGLGISLWFFTRGSVSWVSCLFFCDFPSGGFVSLWSNALDEGTICGGMVSGLDNRW